jgi:orotate phosphoribosyltransferase
VHRLFVPGEFRAHSGQTLNYKIDCDALDDIEIGLFAALILEMDPGPFAYVFGVPRGGLRLATAIFERCQIEAFAPTLIVDDVLTAGASMEQARQVCHKMGSGIVVGAVMFARGPCPYWVTPIFEIYQRRIPR